jgi:nucleoside-diphosphate-sugar epimerase
MSNRILITGAHGFLGKAFFNAVNTSSAEVLSVGRQIVSTGTPLLDLRDKLNVRAILRDFNPTHILNFASLGVTRDQSTLADLLAVNTIGAINIVDGLTAEGLTPHTFFFGTAYEYANTGGALDEASALDPKSAYALSKTTLYYALKHYGTNAPLTFLRLFNVFGIGEPSDRLIPFIVRKTKANEIISLTGGEQYRDFIYLEDLISILLRLVNTPRIGECGLTTINIGTAQGITIRHFIEQVAGVLRKMGMMPQLDFGALPYRAQDPMYCVANNTKLLNLLDEILFTNLKIALEKTVKAIYVN